MGIQREFFDWREPALAGAAGFLRSRHEKAGELDLGGVVVVVPGGRAGRRLLELLVTAADEHGLVLTPPAIVTPEGFPELLYQAKRQFADGLTQQLAWVEALRGAEPGVLAGLLPFPPDREDTPRWLAVAETLRKLHVELAADGLDCGDVLRGAVAVDGFAEHGRWQSLCELQRRYLDVLDRLELWDVQTARLVAVRQREIATDKRIVLVGAVDLNRTQRQILDQVAERVTALVFAPAEMADRFDAHGCLVPAKWTEAELTIADEWIERVDGPAEQAGAVTRWLAGLEQKYRADEIAIGLTDEKLAPHIERQLAQVGLAGRWAIGRELSQTGPYRLLKVAADYAARGRFRDLAALVRHVDVSQGAGVRSQGSGEGKALNPALSQRERGPSIEQRPWPSDALTVLDEFARERVPAVLDEARLKKDEGAAEVLAIHEAARRLVQPLLGESKALGEWAEPLRAILVAVYGGRQLDRNHLADRYLLKALEMLRGGLEALGRVPRELQPVVDARQACRIVLGELAGEGIPPPADPERIELLGWLDLPLDDAPATLVTTVNEGFVPTAATSDVFLPNRLREALGLLDNDRRLARDAYALALICASRRIVKLVVARRDSEGNPLAASRLLFLADGETVVGRARWFFGELPKQPALRNLLDPERAGRSLSAEQKALTPALSQREREGTRASAHMKTNPAARLEVPRPRRLEKAFEGLSVTKFRDYIACPYRFYLRHVLKLEAVSDDAQELDGGAFGDLTHAVLESFGRSAEAREAREKGGEKEIAAYLDHQLDRIAAARFGPKQARAAVAVQIEQIRFRLRAFAAWQAGRTRDGWRIVFSEDSESKRVLEKNWPVDGAAFLLRGRIDRIDFHERLGRVCVLDYKTADRGDDPHRTHRKGDEWIDLQLPLYRHLVAAAKLAGVPADAPIDLGYLVLPLDLKSAGLLLADWDDAQLSSADSKAQEIIRAIRAEQFWPPTTPAPDFFDDVAVICQDRRMGGGGLEEEGDA